ncbi:MAG: hypothetical protein JNM76_10620 [Betaproteobacteria bacterium]|nr:hypothetical protein [Betaproteobacteria bacterium]
MRNLSRMALVAFLGAAATGSQAQSAAELQRCRDLKDPTARLACYDAIPLAGAPAASAPASAPTPATPAPAAPARTPAAAATAIPGSAPQPADFGFERRIEQQKEAAIKSIESRIAGRVEGWEPNTRFTLENGQVWQVSDDSRAFGNANNPRVKISRGTFGTFFLEIEGINAAPRVKRVR